MKKPMLLFCIGLLLCVGCTSQLGNKLCPIDGVDEHRIDGAHFAANDRLYINSYLGLIREDKEKEIRKWSSIRVY